MESDEVSALSMDGASALVGMGFARRMRKDFAEMKLGIPEEEEQHQNNAATGIAENGIARQPTTTAAHRDVAQADDGELIEPFPKTFEEWQKKKDKKHKSKSKKHKKSSKSSKSSGSKRDKDLRTQEERLLHPQQHSANSYVVGGSSPPIMEISIQSTNFQPPDAAPSPARAGRHHESNGNGLHETASDTRSYASSMDSTSASSNHSRSGFGSGSVMGTKSIGTKSIGTKSIGAKSRSSSHASRSRTSGEAMGAVIAKRSLQQQSMRNPYGDLRTSIMSVGSQEDGGSTHLTGQSTHMTGQSSVTVEDLRKLRDGLENALAEEAQVLAIHQRLERELYDAEKKAEKYRNRKEKVERELEAATSEQEDLRKRLGELLFKNSELKSKLRHLEDIDDEKDLDDALENMEEKIKALKLGKVNRKSKAKK